MKAIRNQALKYLLNKRKPWKQNKSIKLVLAQITGNFCLFVILNMEEKKTRVLKKKKGTYGLSSFVKEQTAGVRVDCYDVLTTW